MTNTTRISDLPDNIKMDDNNEAVQNPTYKPMNVHPNPYGNESNPDIIPRNNELSLEQKQMLNLQENHTLPSRDIPIETLSFQSDEQIQANHIPKPKITHDYLRDYHALEDNSIKKHEFNKERERNVDDFLTNIQLPLFIAFLFLIFQMPIVESAFKRYFSFLPLFSSDGNINFYGIVAKSLLFGSCFYSIHNVVQYLITL